jgi:hypothetical protein
VAMSVNDIVTLGAKPLFFLDYYATSKLDVDLVEKVLTLYFHTEIKYFFCPAHTYLLGFCSIFPQVLCNFLGYQGD